MVLEYTWFCSEKRKIRMGKCNCKTNATVFYPTQIAGQEKRFWAVKMPGKPPRTWMRILQTDSLRCGETRLVASVHRTLAKSRLSNPPSIQKVQHRMVLDFLWWGRTDSNHRSETQQIYSLSPLATRELPRMQLSCAVWSR